MTISSCSKNVSPEKSNSVNFKNYLALGDSYTIGESVAESERWPVQLVAKLNNSGYSFNPAKIIAKTGWTTDELNEAISKANITETYDMVSLLIGVNNQYRGRPVGEFEDEFIALLDRAIGFANGKKKNVFVVSIPDYGVTPFAKSRNPVKISMEIDEYNAVQERVCQLKGVKFVNITPISREANNTPSLIAKDGLHPSGEMYTAWVNLILPQIVGIVK